MKRVIWLVMDSFGIGGAKDAKDFDDEGADTLGHINERYPLSIPNMTSLGLDLAYEANNNKPLHVKQKTNPRANAYWGVAKELSKAKDTLSGHWEMAGALMGVEMRYFEEKIPVFPKEMIEKIVKQADIEGILGNRHASGLEIIETLGEEHIRTKKPIFYTSADSVLQIAAHEEYFGLDRLYRVCKIAREVSNDYAIGRVIARPFEGKNKENFQRTKNRKDYSIRSKNRSILEIAKDNDKEVIGIGKIYDIFGGYGITQKRPAYKLQGLVDETLKAMEELKDAGIIYTNFVDFDMEWGHRRDTKGYDEGLEYFDKRLGEILDNLKEDDFLIITADHGCDPTYKGSDHTRENVPVFGIYNGKNLGYIGIRETFADISSSIAKHLQIPKTDIGDSFL